MGIWRERESNMQKGKDLWGLERRGGEGGREKPASGFVLDAEPPMSLPLAAHHCPTAFFPNPSP
jgi:hypothetical protein